MRQTVQKQCDGAAQPFPTAEEAWFWAMAVMLARRDGAGSAWRPPGPERPCEPEDVFKCLDGLYRARQVELLHARIMRIWGERQRAPDMRNLAQRSDWRLWQQAMGELEWSLRLKRIVC